MKFLPALRSGFANYVNFEGRACRSEFWYFVLFTIVGEIATSFIGPRISGLSVTSALFTLAALPPALALAVRRTHDVDLSGWFVCALWILTLATPIPGLLIAPSRVVAIVSTIMVVATFVGAIILVIAWCRRGTVGPNRFGPDRLAELTHQPGGEQATGRAPGIQPAQHSLGKWWLAVLIWGFAIIGYAGGRVAILYTLARSDAYHLGASLVQNSPVVTGRLGAPVTVGKPDAGSLTNALSSDSGTAVMSFPIRGPKGAGHIILQAVRNGRIWRLTHLQLNQEGQTER